MDSKTCQVPPKNYLQFFGWVTCINYYEQKHHSSVKNWKISLVGRFWIWISREILIFVHHNPNRILTITRWNQVNFEKCNLDLYIIQHNYLGGLFLYLLQLVPSTNLWQQNAQFLSEYKMWKRFSRPNYLVGLIGFSQWSIHVWQLRFRWSTGIADGRSPRWNSIFCYGFSVLTFGFSRQYSFPFDFIVGHCVFFLNSKNGYSRVFYITYH